MQITTETFLPVFPGFYGTNFEYNNEKLEIEDINERRAEISLPPVKYDDVKWEYGGYCKEVSQKAVGYIEERLNEIGLACKLAFKKLDSPREYNFHNDQIRVDVTFDPEQLRKLFFECPDEAFRDFYNQFLPQSGFIPFEETLAKASPEYWKQTDFNNFHDFGLACELILKNHPETQFNEDDFIERSTHEVEIGIENWLDLVKVRVDIDKWNEHCGYLHKYPATSKLFDTDPDTKSIYEQGDVVFINDSNDYAVILGCVDGFREELRTDLDGMVCFDEIRIADSSDADHMAQTRFGSEILSFIRENI